MQAEDLWSVIARQDPQTVDNDSADERPELVVGSSASLLRYLTETNLLLLCKWFV